MVKKSTPNLFQSVDRLPGKKTVISELVVSVPRAKKSKSYVPGDLLSSLPGSSRPSAETHGRTVSYTACIEMVKDMEKYKSQFN